MLKIRLDAAIMLHDTGFYIEHDKVANAVLRKPSHLRGLLTTGEVCLRAKI